MTKFFIPVALAVSMLAVNPGHAQNPLEQDVVAAPSQAAKTDSSNLQVLGAAAGAVKEVASGSFLEDYMKEATRVEAIVDEKAGPNASLWKKFWVRVTHPKQVIWPMVKFVGERALLPIVKAVVAA